MQRTVVCLAGLLAIIAFGPVARAANSTNGGSPEATKEGGIAGDPRGAIRALGGTSQTDFQPEHNKVDVPKLGGSSGAAHTGGPPPGATGPR